MAQTPPTLNSRLRVLIAKTFRAEKLYSSMRNLGEGFTGVSLGKLANELRAKEWQAHHAHLRARLNELLRTGNSSRIIEELERLHEEFYQLFIESGASLDKGTAALVEAARRQEFAHVLKLSTELIRHKARAQASKVISDELSAILESVGHGASPEDFEKGIDLDRPSSWTGSATPEDRPTVPDRSRRGSPDRRNGAPGSKVIPLKPRISSQSLGRQR